MPFVFQLGSEVGCRRLLQAGPKQEQHVRHYDAGQLPEDLAKCVNFLTENQSRIASRVTSTLYLSKVTAVYTRLAYLLIFSI